LHQKQPQFGTPVAGFLIEFCHRNVGLQSAGWSFIAPHSCEMTDCKLLITKYMQFMRPFGLFDSGCRDAVYIIHSTAQVEFLFWGPYLGLGEQRKGTSPSRPPRTGRESLDSSGSNRSSQPPRCPKSAAGPDAGIAFPATIPNRAQDCPGRAAARPDR
jgi:hypothetical protein